MMIQRQRGEHEKGCKITCLRKRCQACFMKDVLCYSRSKSYLQVTYFNIIIYKNIGYSFGFLLFNFFQSTNPLTFWNRSLPTPKADNRGGSPRYIHPQGDDRGMDRGKGQLLKLVSFVLSWRRHTPFLLKVYFQVGYVADTWAGLDQSRMIQTQEMFSK